MLLLFKMMTGSVSGARATLTKKATKGGKVDGKKRRKDIARTFRS
jgi:hypothetical protein